MVCVSESFVWLGAPPGVVRLPVVTDWCILLASETPVKT